MDSLGRANAAAVTAVAAYRALAPFLKPNQRVALRNSISTTQPLHALAHVLRAAHRACAQQQQQQTQQQTQSQQQPQTQPQTQPPSQQQQQVQQEPTTSSTITLAFTDEIPSSHDIPSCHDVSSSDSAHSLWSIAPITPSSTSTLKMTGSGNGFALPRPIGHDDDLPWSSTVWTNDGREIAWGPFSPSPSPTPSTSSTRQTPTSRHDQTPIELMKAIPTLQTQPFTRQ